MIDASEAYRAAVLADTRRTAVRVDTDVVDPDLIYLDVTSSEEAAISRTSRLRDNDELTPYATLETNRWVLNGKDKLFLDDDRPERAADKPGWISAAQSESDGAFSSPLTITVGLEYHGLLQRAAVYFSADPADGVPDTFAVEVFAGEELIATWSVTGNRAAGSESQQFEGYNPTALRLTVSSWSLPYRRARIRQIIPGVHLRWTGDDLASLSVKAEGDLSCASLPYGTARLAVDNSGKVFEPRNKEGFFRSIQARQAVQISMGVYVEDGPEFIPVGTFFQHSGGWSTSDNGLSIDWDLVDIIGLLSEREYEPPEDLPETLEEWAASLVAQLGPNFEQMYSVDPNYAGLPVTAAKRKAVLGVKSGDLIRYLGLATGTWPRADARTGALTFEPTWDQGAEITLDNMNVYPTMRENDDVAAVNITKPEVIDDETGEIIKEEAYSFGGTNLAASRSVGVSSPFIRGEEDVTRIFRQIISQYGGNAYEITWRGDPSAEVGDVMTLALDARHGASARMIEQTLDYTSGVLAGCKAVLIQPEGYYNYTDWDLLTADGTWTVPTGVHVLQVILVGGGWAGENGDDGTDRQAGLDGWDGRGGKVYATGINVHPGQVLSVSIGQGGQTFGQTPGDTTFGGLTSAAGRQYTPSYTDIRSGSAYGRTGIKNPLPNTGDGGAGGLGGAQGRTHTVKEKDDHGFVTEHTVWDKRPGKGTKGSPGASGCVRIYYNRQEVTE